MKKKEKKDIPNKTALQLKVTKYVEKMIVPILHPNSFQNQIMRGNWSMKK